MSGLSNAIERMRSASFTLPTSAEEKKRLLFSAALFIYFAALSFMGVANFVWLNRLTVEMGAADIPRGAEGLRDETTQKADELNKKITAYLKYKDDGVRMIELAESTGVPPIAGLQASVSQELSVPEYTPSVVIKALVVMGGNAVATLDIDGEPAGQVYTKGMSFGGRKGRIIDINSKGVSWIWSGKRYRSDL